MKALQPKRLFVFMIATIALANFFEAGRLLAEEMTLKHLPMSVISLLVLALSLFVIGYWIYKEEKEKNNLRIKFAPYEWMYEQNTKHEAGSTKQEAQIQQLEIRGAIK